MAAYHYKLQIVPSNQKFQCEENYWTKEQPHPDMLDSYRKLLPIDNAWGETEEYRSEENHSVLYIWFESNKVWSIQFEYAPIYEGKDTLLNDVLELCIKYDYKLYSESTGAILFPCRDVIWEDFQLTLAYKIFKRNGLNGFN